MSSSVVDVAATDTDTSIPASPTDTRNLFVGRELLVNEDHQPQEIIPGSFKSTDTVRRLPEPLTYGTINTQSQPSIHSKNDPNESVKLSDRSDEIPSESSRPKIQTSTSYPINRGRSRANKSVAARRTPSKVRAPHRGQEFSVDDDVTEVESHLTKSGRKQPPTLRRRPTGYPVPTLTRVASEEEENIANDETDVSKVSGIDTGALEPDTEGLTNDGLSNHSAYEELASGDGVENEDDESSSDAESFTLKDRQQAINETHPFGIRIWKPALYKKNRSVQKDAEGDIHSSPGGLVSRWLLFFNILWTIWFGWWLGLVALAGAIVCFIFGAAPGAVRYGRILLGLSGYLLYPFGKFVRLEQDEAYAHEDEGEGRSITEYEQWQNGDLEDGRLFFGPQGNRSIVGRSRQSITSVASENDSLLARNTRSSHLKDLNLPQKRRLFGRGQWNTGRVIFFLFFYGLITPLLILVSGICWFLVFWIPMGKVTLLLLYHLRRHPLAISFQPDSAYSRGTVPNSSILVCTYRAVGLKYWKYTIDGTNIFLINLMGVVLFVVFDYFILVEALGLKGLIITHSAFLFIAALLSVIPLAYFIGQAVASISAQSSMGIGAAINALFSTLVEVFLYCVALNQGKGKLVEGSIIGSIFAGVLFLPGLSMCFGAIKRKTQRFNAKSASATSTMLLFAVIAAFGPTLFYQIYGTHEMNCMGCIETDGSTNSRDCRRCYFSQTPSLDDRFYVDVVRPFCWIAAALLFLAYVIGLWFTLRTHAAVIWNEVDEKKVQESTPASALASFYDSSHGHSLRHVNDVRRKESHDAQMHKRIVGQSLKQLGLESRKGSSRKNSNNEPRLSQFSLQAVHQPPPKCQVTDNSKTDIGIPGLIEAQNTSLVREVADIAATAVTIAANDAYNSTINRRTSHSPHHRPPQSKLYSQGIVHDVDQNDNPQGHMAGGHDAPNWSRRKSAVVLCVATVLYALIAEILVGTIDVVLKNVSVSEKFLGITLFALVPNTTEFLNAISFAVNGNIALSMEIGSAYVLQVCLLQIPALVLYNVISVHYLASPGSLDYTFTLIFPQWDMTTVTICVFLLSYVYGEGKSNYFKGSILLLSYLVVIIGFWLSDLTDEGATTDPKFRVI